MILCSITAVVEIGYMLLTYIHLSKYSPGDMDDAHRTAIHALVSGINPYSHNVSEVHPPNGPTTYIPFCYGFFDLFYYTLFFELLRSTNFGFIGVMMIANLVSLGVLCVFLKKLNFPFLFIIPTALCFILVFNDILVITCFVGFLYFYFKAKRYVVAAFMLALAVSVKPFPFLIVPLWLFQKNRKLNEILVFFGTAILPTFAFGLMGPIDVFNASIWFQISGRSKYAYMGGSLGYLIFNHWTTLLLILANLVLWIIYLKKNFSSDAIILSSLIFVLLSPAFLVYYIYYFFSVIAVSMVAEQEIWKSRLLSLYKQYSERKKGLNPIIINQIQYLE